MFSALTSITGQEAIIKFQSGFKINLCASLFICETRYGDRLPENLTRPQTTRVDSYPVLWKKLGTTLLGKVENSVFSHPTNFYTEAVLRLTGLYSDLIFSLVPWSNRENAGYPQKSPRLIYYY